MDTDWQETFRVRMRRFTAQRPTSGESVPVSIKVRVSSGCFHREHSPRAYAIIDRALSTSPPDSVFSFEEHESGPELLAYVAAATAGISLAASIINLISVVVKARSEGIKQGDRPSDPLELIVRRIDEGGGFREEVVLRVAGTDRVRKKRVEDLLTKAVRTVLSERKR